MWASGLSGLRGVLVVAAATNCVAAVALATSAAVKTMGVVRTGRAVTVCGAAVVVATRDGVAGTVSSGVASAAEVVTSSHRVAGAVAVGLSASGAASGAAEVITARDGVAGAITSGGRVARDGIVTTTGELRTAGSVLSTVVFNSIMSVYNI